MAKREREADVRRALDRLASLRIDPEARSRLASELVRESSRADVLFACAAALDEHPIREGRDPLIEAYGRVAADPAKLDRGGGLRAALLRAMRHVAGREDIPLLEAATLTYETSVQGPGATELRGAALVTLLEVAPEAAALHAARILAEADDPRRNQWNTGEPAVTAARVLGAAGHSTALYMAALQAWEPPDEVIAECLRQLTDLPGTFAASLIERFAGHRSDIVAAGLVDLVAENADAAAVDVPLLVRWLRGCQLDVYRYALATFVASRLTPIHELAATLVREEFDRARLGIAKEALALARGVAVLERARIDVEARLENVHGGEQGSRTPHLPG